MSAWEQQVPTPPRAGVRWQQVVYGQDACAKKVPVCSTLHEFTLSVLDHWRDELKLELQQLSPGVDVARIFTNPVRSNV